jgi:hypothetical protein
MRPAEPGAAADDSIESEVALPLSQRHERTFACRMSVL